MHTAYVEPDEHKELTNTAGFLGRPLVVLLTGNVLLPNQLKCRQALKEQSVPMTKTCPLSFAISWDSRISTAALFNFCAGRNKHITQNIHYAKLALKISDYFK